MTGTFFFEGFIQLLEQLFLTLGQFHWRFNHNAAHEITGTATTHWYNALAAQTELLAGLRFFSNLQFY